jgi:hypothetical protein
LLWRGDRSARVLSVRAAERLGSLRSAFAVRDCVAQDIAYSDDAVGDVRDEILACDGVLVWVNPIQDGATRSTLDLLLREAAERGVWVSAHPDTILRMGTKDVLYRLRDLPWGSDVALYDSPADFAERFPLRLSRHGVLVVKQSRGNGGNGVWKVDASAAISQSPALTADTLVAVQDARTSTGADTTMRLSEVLTLAGECFGWSASLIDQPFQQRVAEGMVRCYFAGDRVVGFCRQWPRRGLQSAEALALAAGHPASVMHPATADGFQHLRHSAEARWLPAAMAVPGLEPHALPVIWDADVLFGARTPASEDDYVLCQINTSAVWPFPPTAAPAIAEAALEAIRRSG